MEAIFLLVILGILFFVMAGFLFKGKGSFLIAGYNTASQKERDQYDELKLCKSTSVICAISGLSMLAMAYIICQRRANMISEDQMLLWFAIITVALLASSIVGILYSNTRCKK